MGRALNEEATLDYVTQMVGELARMLEKMNHPEAAELTRIEARLRAPRQNYEGENVDRLR